MVRGQFTFHFFHAFPIVNSSLSSSGVLDIFLNHCYRAFMFSVFRVCFSSTRFLLYYYCDSDMDERQKREWDDDGNWNLIEFTNSQFSMKSCSISIFIWFPRLNILNTAVLCCPITSLRMTRHVPLFWIEIKRKNIFRYLISFGISAAAWWLVTSAMTLPTMGRRRDGKGIKLFGKNFTIRIDFKQI